MKRLICFFKSHNFNQEDAFLASFEAQIMGKKNITIECIRCKQVFLLDKEIFETVEMLN